MRLRRGTTDFWRCASTAVPERSGVLRHPEVTAFLPYPRLPPVAPVSVRDDLAPGGFAPGPSGRGAAGLWRSARSRRACTCRRRLPPSTIILVIRLRSRRRIRPRSPGLSSSISRSYPLGCLRGSSSRPAQTRGCFRTTLGRGHSPCTQPLAFGPVGRPELESPTRHRYELRSPCGWGGSGRSRRPR